MVSEVRKVLDSYSFFEIPLWLTRLDVAERADAAKREEPVQELRQAVKHFIDKWLSSATKEHQYLSQIIYVMTDELNAIIAAKPDPVENRQTAASGPVMHESVWCDGKNVTLEEMIEKAKDVDQWREIKPVIEPAVAEKVYEIASRAVRDAMPDVLDAVADPLESDREFRFIADLLQNHAAKLRKERATGHAAAVAAVSDAIGKACEAERKERGS